jgi:magnesium chelatase subunit I
LGEDFSGLIRRFHDGLTVETSDLMSATEFLGQFQPRGPQRTPAGERASAELVPGFDRIGRGLGIVDESPAEVASALEFCLEGLHLNKRLNKNEGAPRGKWRFAAAS